MNPANFDVTSRLSGDTAILYPRGYLNNIAGESLVQECDVYIEQGIKKIVLNFKETDFINSIGISLLLNIIEGLKDCGGTLCFTDMGRIHIDTFEMLGLTKYLLVFNTEEEALKNLHAEGTV